jgi:SAM-dependent methyltransferase
MLVKYNPRFFNPTSLEHAKKIILQDECISDQWGSETKWTIDFFREKNLFDKDSIVLDWGCGIGRLAKPIIEEFNCKVVGVDFQPNMLRYATEYVNHSNFRAIDNEEFSQLPDNYFTVGIAVWALQHALYTTPIIHCIQKKLNFKSKFCIVDSNVKHWPVERLEEPHITSKEDLLVNTLSYRKDYEGNFWTSNPAWVSADSNKREILDYFSVEEIATLSSTQAGDITLSKHFDNSWSGILINDKKYFFYG